MNTRPNEELTLMNEDQFLSFAAAHVPFEDCLSYTRRFRELDKEKLCLYLDVQNGQTKISEDNKDKFCEAKTEWEKYEALKKEIKGKTRIDVAYLKKEMEKEGQ